MGWKSLRMLLHGGIALLVIQPLLTRPLGADNYYTVTPCRLLDTRNTTALATNLPTVFGVAGMCGIPPEASSVAFNVTLVPQGVGVNLGMFPGNLAAPPTTNVVSSTSATRASAAVVALSFDGQGTVKVVANSASSGVTHLILDVNGYFVSSSPGGLAQLYAQGGNGDPGSTGNPLSDPMPTNTLGQQPSGSSLTEPPSGSGGSLITPLRRDGASRKFFNFNGTVVPLIGVSADAACHLHLGNGLDMCTFTATAKANYTKVLSDAAAKGLNKIRLWVSLNGGNWQAGRYCVAPIPPDPNDQPFKYYAPGSPGFPSQNPPPDGIGFWNLDERNDVFFSNLKTVADYAAANGIFVEVTFFAPWIAEWQLSPWNPAHGRLSTDASHAIGVGFTDRGYFVQLDGSNGGANPNEQMRAYQYNVIDWTIQALWGNDHVYWEIANEPENGNPSSQCQPTAPIAAVGSAVTAWQQKMIAEVVSYEANNYVTPNGNLAYPHLIAVQPFTVNGTTPYLPGGSVGNVTVLNGHYTSIKMGLFGPRWLVGGALGAITMARTYAGIGGVLVASNEDKISGQTSSPDWPGPAVTCGWDNPTVSVDCFGEADSARAGAWEFMLDFGAAFDHFGYFWASDYGQMVRQQMGALRIFVGGLPLRQLMTSPDPLLGAGPTWVGIGPSPYSDRNRNPNKYFAALEPTSAATTITYALYIHHSGPRLKPQGGYLGFQGYLPTYSSTSGPSDPQYSESLPLCLSAQATQYLVQWIDPSTGQEITHRSIPWNGQSSCGTTISSPKYAFDIALKITKIQ